MDGAERFYGELVQSATRSIKALENAEAERRNVLQMFGIAILVEGLAIGALALTLFLR